MTGYYGGGGTVSSISSDRAGEPRDRGGDVLMQMLGSEVEGASEYYRPGVCDRETRFPVDDPDRLNRSLTALESYLTRYLGICGARVVVCLILYKGLTFAELQAITKMKQSAVSRTITALKERRLVACRIGKKFDVGRPYQFVVLNVDPKEIIDCVGETVSRHADDIGYMEGWFGDEAGETRD